MVFLIHTELRCTVNHTSENGQFCPRIPTASQFENLALRSSSHYAARRSHIDECGTVPVRAALVSSSLQHFCKVGSVIRDLISCSGLFFNNSLFVYAYSVCSKAMREGRTGFFLILFTGTNFRKLCQNHVIVRDLFAPHLGTVAQITFR